MNPAVIPTAIQEKTVQANVHTPQRLDGETFANYVERRKQSHFENWRAKNSPKPSSYGLRDRRVQVKAAGGIRQFKRQRNARRLAEVSA